MNGIDGDAFHLSIRLQAVELSTFHRLNLPEGEASSLLFSPIKQAKRGARITPAWNISRIQGRT